MAMAVPIQLLSFQIHVSCLALELCMWYFMRGVSSSAPAWRMCRGTARSLVLVLVLVGVLPCRFPWRVSRSTMRLAESFVCGLRVNPVKGSWPAA